MDAEKILAVVAIYEDRLKLEGVVARRMDPSRAFASLSTEEILAHTLYLICGIKELAVNPEKVGKTGRHLGSIQTCLGFAGWYTLEDVMSHNRP